MNEILNIDLWFVGPSLAVGWILILILCWASSRAWSWVDDSKPTGMNPAIKFVASITGWKWKGMRNGHSWDWYHKDGKRKRDGSDSFVVFPFLWLLMMSPIIIFYEISLFIAGMTALAHLTRYARRHKKVFDKHVEDKDAHK